MFEILVMGFVCGVLAGTIAINLMDENDIKSCGVEF